MSLEKNLITIHIYSLFSLLVEVLTSLLETEPYLDFDTERFINQKGIDIAIKLTDGSKIYLAEKYGFEEYNLKIIDYNYSFVDPHQNLKLSCDNRPHHPEILTFPHHKHYYPKDKYKPVAFSGALIEFLQEVKWKIEDSPS